MEKPIDITHEEAKSSCIPEEANDKIPGDGYCFGLISPGWHEKNFCL